MRTKALALGLATLVAASSGNARPLEAQTADYYEQTYLSSSHNWNFRLIQRFTTKRETQPKPFYAPSLARKST